MSKTERESKVQESIMRIIRKYGGYVYKNAQSTFTEKGRPDLTACIPTDVKHLKEMLNNFTDETKIGLFVGLELKRDGHLDEVSEAQKIVGQKIKNSAGMWFLVDNPLVIEALMNRLTGEKDDNF